jgi:hypothetical protein
LFRSAAIPVPPGLEKCGTTTRGAQILAGMDTITPWPDMAAEVQTGYPKISENGDRAVRP